jgi:uncharacterized phage-associated protein
MDSLKLPPTQIANYFTCTIDRESGDSITHLKLQKLMYYAQAWSMVVLGKSLYTEDFQAWTHGPVLPSIWEEDKDFGFDSLPICDCNSELPQEVIELIEDIKKVYGEKSAKYLEELTHSEEPWQLTRGAIPLEVRSTKPIEKSLMTDFYKELQVRLNGN